MDRCQIDTKGKKRACRNGLHFEFYMPDLRYKKLLLFVLNFNTTSDEDGVIDQSYLLLLKIKSLWDFRMSVSRKNDKESYTPQVGYIKYENAAHTYRPVPPFPSFAAPRKGLFYRLEISNSVKVSEGNNAILHYTIMIRSINSHTDIA